MVIVLSLTMASVVQWIRCSSPIPSLIVQPPRRLSVVGNYSVMDANPTVTGSNFIGSPVYVGNLTVTVKALTAAYNASDKIYNSNTTATVNGSSIDVVSGDSVSFANTSANFDTKNVGTSKTVSVSGISISGADAANYSLQNTAASTTAKVTAKNLTATYTASNKIYDGNTSVSVTGASSDIFIGDTVTFANTGETFDTKNVGTGKTVSVSGISIGGFDVGNYSLQNTTASTTANVSAKNLTAAYTASNKIYDGNAVALVNGASSDIISGDTVTFDNTSATFDSKNVGTGKTVSVSGISIAGADAGNYSLQNTAAITHANVSKATLSLAVNNVTKQYDGSTSLSNIALVPSGVFFNDQVSAVANTGDFVSKNAGNHVGFTLSGLTLSGGDAGNYLLQSPTLSGFGVITPKPLSLPSSFASNKVFDGNSIAQIMPGDLSGLVGQETLVLVASGRFSDASVGNKSVMAMYQLSNGDFGGLASNYVLDNQILHASITSFRPIVNPVSPVTPLSPDASNQGGGGAKIVISGQSLSNQFANGKQECSLEHPESCDCKEALVPGIIFCLEPPVISHMSNQKSY